jgi:hypothetical protein
MVGLAHRIEPVWTRTNDPPHSIPHLALDRQHSLTGVVPVRVYVEIARLAFRQNLAYRTAAFAGLFTNSVFGVILASVMISFYGSLDAPSVEGWSQSDAVTLIWINQALIMPVYIWGWWGCRNRSSPGRSRPTSSAPSPGMDSG